MRCGVSGAGRTSRSKSGDGWVLTHERGWREGRGRKGRTTRRRSVGSMPRDSSDFARRSRTNSLSRSAYSQPAGERSESALYECSMSDCPDYKELCQLACRLYVGQ